MPPRSMKAPYSVRFLTMPSTIWPSFSFSSVISFSSARSFSRSTRRDSTMLPRFLLNLMTLKRCCLPMNASRLRTGRRSTCEPGRNAFTPPRMVTERPPFTRALMVPSISSSRSHAPEISSQTFSRSAFSFERTQRPSSFSRLSRKTSISSPSLTPTDAVGLRELVERDRSFGLVADVDDDVVLADVNHAAFDDVAFFDVLVLEGLFEQCCEALLLVVVLGCHRDHAVFLCLSTRRSFDGTSKHAGRLALSRAVAQGFGLSATRGPDHSWSAKVAEISVRPGESQSGPHVTTRPRGGTSRSPSRRRERPGPRRCFYTGRAGNPMKTALIALAVLLAPVRRDGRRAGTAARRQGKGAQGGQAAGAVEEAEAGRRRGPDSAGGADRRRRADVQHQRQGERPPEAEHQPRRRPGVRRSRQPDRRWSGRHRRPRERRLVQVHVAPGEAGDRDAAGRRQDRPR